MIFRTLSRLIILVLGVVVLAELVSKDEPKQSKPKDEPEDAPLPEGGLVFPKSPREMSESLHVHAFMLPLLFFVLSRILNMVSMRDGFRTVTHVVGFVGIVMNLTGPWLVRFVSPGFAGWLVASYVLLGSVIIVYIACPMYEMWGVTDEAPDRPLRR